MKTISKPISVAVALLLLISSISTTLKGQTFTDVTASTNLPTDMEQFRVQAYDFNNDNNVDIIYPSSIGTDWQFFMNNGNGTFSDISANAGLLIPKTFEIKFADVNKDGMSDVIASRDSSGFSVIKVYKQNVPNLFSDITSTLNLPNPIVGSFQHLMDFDIDGDIDLVLSTNTVGDRSFKAIKASIQSGMLTYDTLVTIITLDSVLLGNQIPRAPITADFDNDGDEDIVYQRFCGTCGLLGDGNFYAHTYGFIRNDGGGNFIEASGVNGIGILPRNPSVWDFDNNGTFDLVSGSSDNVSNMQGSRIRVWQGNGDGTFNDITTTTQLYDGFSRYYSVYGVCDFNNDAYQDVYSEIDGGPNPTHKLYQNNSGVSFTEVSSSVGINLNSSFTSGSNVWMDYDNDGDLDLFANVSGTLSVLNNNTSGKNWIKMRLYGCSTNADAYGVRIEVKFGGKTVALTPGQGHYKMKSDMHIGLDTASVIDTIAIYWHLSPTVYLTNVSPNQKLNLYEVTNGACWPCTSVTTIYNYINVIDYDTVTTYISVTDTLIINAQITGVPGPNNTNTIQVYPNPTSTHLYIDNGNFASMNGYSIDIRDISGAVVFGSLINQQQFYIDLSTWSGSGTYVMRVYDNFGTIIATKKIIIQ